LDTLELFWVDFHEELEQEFSPLMPPFFQCFVQLLKQPHQTVSFLSSLFFSLRRFIIRFQHCLFAFKDTSYCSDLCFEILRYANSVHATTRAEAGSLFYLMIKVNFILRGNFSRTKLQSTIAISRLCGEAGIQVNLN
jgi:hypothetical protein